jgi:hypothetical protein
MEANTENQQQEQGVTPDQLLINIVARQRNDAQGVAAQLEAQLAIAMQENARLSDHLQRLMTENAGLKEAAAAALLNRAERRAKR